MGLAAFDFPDGTLTLTEAGHEAARGAPRLRGAGRAPGARPGRHRAARRPPAGLPRRAPAENHTLKRALTDPRLLAGIGGAYSDEILHRARLSRCSSPRSLDDDGGGAAPAGHPGGAPEWTERLRREAGDGFPEKVTAFREGMAVHGRHRQPCPDCGTAVQRIVHAENETDYCPRCQTGGRILSDRSLSRLLKDDWPRTVEEMEALEERRR